MKKMTAFVFIVLFALVFLLSYMFGIPEWKYGKVMNLAGQIGLGVSILMFIMLPGKKSTGKRWNG